MQIHILYDEYTEDEPAIYGVYSTYEVAKQALARLSSTDNPYGKSLNEDDTIEIRSYDVYDTPAV